MKMRPFSLVLKLLGISLFLGLAGCISQKKVSAFKQKHAEVLPAEYAPQGKGNWLAAEVHFFMVDRAEKGDAAPIEMKNTDSFLVSDYVQPAVKVVIAPPVFLKKSHGKKYSLSLKAENLVLSNGFIIEKREETIVSDQPQTLFFNLNKEKVTIEERMALTLNLIDENGAVIPSEELLFVRNFSFAPPIPKTDLEKTVECPRKRFTLLISRQVVSPDNILTKEPVEDAVFFNAELGKFVSDSLGRIFIELCLDSLPLRYEFEVNIDDKNAPEAAYLEFSEEEDVFELIIEKRESSYRPPPPISDMDGDGVPDDEDDCPTQPGPASWGGCPESGQTVDIPDRKSEQKVVSPSPSPIDEEAYWNVIKSSELPGDFEDYLETFPEGKYIQEAQKRLQDNYTRIAKGLMSILVPDTMELDVPEVVSVMISSDTSRKARERVIDEFIDLQDLPPEDIPEVRNELIKITDIMRAELRDPSPTEDPNFFIDPPGEREQKVDLYNGDPTVWNWTVTPLKKGNKQLNVVVSIIFDKNGREVPKVEEQIFKVYITVQPGFWEKNWWWVALVGILGLVLLLLFFYRRKQKQQELLQLRLPYQEVTRLVGEGEQEQALQILESALDGVSDKYHQQVVLLKSRIAENEENLMAGVVETKEATLVRNQVSQSILNLLSKLRKEFQITE